MRNKKLISIAVLFAAAIAIFSTANSAQGADNDFVITEVMYDSVKNIDNKKIDWLELHAVSDKTLPLKSSSLDKPTEYPLKDFYICTKKNSSGSTFCNTSWPVYLISNQPTTELKIKKNDFILISSDSSIFNDIPKNDNLILLKVSSSFNLLSNEDGFAAYSLGVDSDNNKIWQEKTNYYPFFDEKPLGHTGYSLEKSDFNSSEYHYSCDPSGSTPGEEPNICETVPTPSSEDDDATDTGGDTGTVAPSDDAPADSPKKIYSKNLRISELLPNPSADEDTGEFTEIQNIDLAEAIALSGWKLEDKAGNSYSLPDISLQPGEYRAFYRNNSKFSLNNTGNEDVFLKNPDGEIVDQASYSGTVKENCAYALANGEFSWTSTPTPGEKNIFDAPAVEASIEASTEDSSDNDDKIDTPKKVYLNEILPNPKDGSDGEYIEIASNAAGPVDLFSWRIKDGSKSKGYQFKEHTVINPSEYLAIYRPDSKIAINNSDESIHLYNPKNEIISSVSFAKSIKNSSYNFDGKAWKWSKYLTPGKKNKFDSAPSVKITKPKNIFKDIVAEFSAKAKDKETKKLKYSWDFGDGKKSSFAKTSHKYLATGKYTVTLSVRDDSQTVEKSFSLKVKKYPRPDLEIVKIVPNPAGNDSDGEIIEVKNSSGKKVGLKGWKIATGSDDKIYNHPISDEFALNANETKTITREFSKFSLNNKAGKVQLVMPDGKVVDEIEYSKDPPDSLRDSKRAGKIAEDEVYAKIDGEWKWIAPDAEKENTDEAVANEEFDSEEVTGEDTNNDGEVLGATDENELSISNYNPAFSSEDAYIFLSDIGFLKSQNKAINYCPMKNTTGSLEYFLISSI